ncbi:hypothetical protein GQ43DRAFT_441249 [Delitschia confertaspora ATCC 74209]|uniref:Tafazzin n=1 Tax=Delitschia confertaspora ATCC 74209 TaxID=1513339 RepID=A0A9P4JQJ9_9PLEO|nr:hypothetical protein GQ43DRAFT_441249 [Delitschia confertaspora ATCC 74209]
MPKKHTPKYTTTSNSYVHPSLQSSRSSSSAPPPAQTVNERIRQLRREQAPRGVADRRDEITDLVTARNLPPALRRILNIPEVNPPREKLGTRTRVGTPIRSRRPPPGPAAPNSWLQNSRHAPRHLRQLNGAGGNIEGNILFDRFSSLATLNDNNYKRIPPERSLMHMALKTFALNWEYLAEYEQHYLAAIPPRLKEILLSYVARYGYPGCMDLMSFKLLFLTEDDVVEGSGGEDIVFLDLTGLLNPRFTLSDFYKYLGRPKFTLAEAVGDLSLTDEKGKGKATEKVAESWEDEADPLAPSIPIPITVSRFPQLTRLSLAHAGSQASWPQLLTLSSKLHTLTHLSLAYWPTPSATPNSATSAMVSDVTRPVSLGGSSLYSELDDDWHEAANILRRLSFHTYRLKWLDLEGCTWFKALTWGGDRDPTPQTSAADRAQDEWVRANGPVGPDWTEHWCQIEYLNLSQGWIPQNTADIISLPAGVISVQLLNWLRWSERGQEVGGEERKQRRPQRNNVWHVDAESWVEREQAARNVASEINRLRKEGSARYCKINHGWDPY